MRSYGPRHARTDHDLRKRIRLSVAAVASTALVGGMIVAAPAPPLNPLLPNANAQVAPGRGVDL